ncbi:unnamed protein product [Scytosiphon promiscuus]
MGRPKRPGEKGTRKREELERQEAQELLEKAAANPPRNRKEQEQEQQQQQPAMTFMQQDFGLDRRLIKAVAKMGFVYPTLVQNKCIPLALKGKDLLVRARTGSGKTAAFALPLLQKILRRKEAEPDLSRGVRAVVLVPTRELCEQARVHLSELMHYCRDQVSLLALVDDNMAAQEAALRDKADVLIATPARLVAHLKAGNVELKDTVETLVVDEADLVLSFGYSEDIRAVTKGLPKICQGFLMSATLSAELEDLKRVVLHSPAVLKLEEGAQDGRLSQFYLSLANKDDKFLVVFAFIKLGLLEGKGLFFVNETESSYRLKLFLEQFHVRSAVLNAELPLNSRLHILQEFNRGIFDYLIVTDNSMDVQGVGGVEVADSDEDGEAGGDGSDPTAGGTIRVTTAGAAAADGDGADGEGEDAMDQSSSSGEEDEDEGEDEDEEGESSSSMSDSDEEEGDAGDSGGGQSDAGEEAAGAESAASSGKKARRVSKRAKGGGGRGEESEFGAARGVDFRGVSFVLNVDFPPTPSSYTHRVGRTARGGASGTALSLVLSKDEKQCRTLQRVQSSQPSLAAPALDGGGGAKAPGRDSIVAAMGAQTPEEAGGRGSAAGTAGFGGGGSWAQPAPLAFDIREIERFRYRVEDTLKKVTRVSVREARAAELKAEIVNSQKLAGYFKENAGDLKVLRHDKSVLHPLRKLDHLKHIPDYLMPRGLQTGQDPTQRQRKRLKRARGGAKRRLGQGQDQGRRKDNDPLQTFEASELGADGSYGPGGGGPRERRDGDHDGGEEEDPKEVAKRMNEERESRVMQTGDFSGESTSGRRRWQQRRGKGKHGGGGNKGRSKKTANRFDLPV